MTTPREAIKPNGLITEPQKPNRLINNPNGFTENPNGFFENRTKPKKPDIDNGIGKDIDIGIGIGTEKGSGGEPTSKRNKDQRPSNKQFVETCRTRAKQLNKPLDENNIYLWWNEFNNSGNWNNWDGRLQLKITLS